MTSSRITEQLCQQFQLEFFDICGRTKTFRNWLTVVTKLVQNITYHFFLSFIFIDSKISEFFFLVRVSIFNYDIKLKPLQNNKI